jgi:hypothetical protein
VWVVLLLPKRRFVKQLFQYVFYPLFQLTRRKIFFPVVPLFTRGPAVTHTGVDRLLFFREIDVTAGLFIPNPDHPISVTQQRDDEKFLS